MTVKENSPAPEYSILLYGIGNPARGDDALGTGLERYVAHQRFPGVDTECNYQLNVEDALTISRYDIVVFADATHSDIEGARLSRLQPSAGLSFTTHAMAPSHVLSLCRELYRRSPAAYVLEMQGWEWELGSDLTPRARENLAAACRICDRLFRDPSPQTFAQLAQLS
ncbi:MAG: hydrogenase maturation protease [Chitinivibrionales bacterium]|nr:hydrogenase maturation protease [Chitinivibrionales bacterium]MBD3395374.1 hydrogenase maturation protease [Chitinivibrionales bacterium]